MIDSLLSRSLNRSTFPIGIFEISILSLKTSKDSPGCNSLIDPDTSIVSLKRIESFSLKPQIFRERF